MTEEESSERGSEGAREQGATLSERLAGEGVQGSEYQSGVPAMLRRAARRFVGQSGFCRESDARGAVATR